VIVVGKTWDQLETYQPTILKLLANSIIKNRVAHAYLFEGSRGTGKKEISLLFAKSLFCLQRKEYQPCNQCINCRRIDSRNHPDIHVIEPEGQSIKKWQIQSLQEEFSKTGIESNKKLYIIEHADRMTANAANSLLKFLEEPSSDTVAILLTENIHRILNTIRSRCQILSFQPLPPGAIAEQLLEDGIPPYLAKLVSQLTNNVSEAFEICRDDWFAQARKLVLELYEVLNSRPEYLLLFIQTKWMEHFTEKDQFDRGLDLLLLLYKDLLHLQLGREEHVVYIDQLSYLRQKALQLSNRKISDHMSFILEAKGRLGTNMNPHLLMEQLVLKLQEG
jgi:DNA polymerase III subunit delta'